MKLQGPWLEALESRIAEVVQMGTASNFRGKSGTLGTLKSGQTFLIWIRFSMTPLITSVTSEWERFRSCLTSESLWSVDISSTVLEFKKIRHRVTIHHPSYIYPIGMSKFDAYLDSFEQLPFLLGHSGWEFHPFRTSTPGWIPHTVDVALSNVRNYTAWQEPLGRSCHGQDMVCCAIGMVIRLLKMINTYY